MYLGKWRNPVRLTRATYGSWANARHRCHNPKNVQFPEYGGRGITMCDRWREDYDAFYEDMGPRPVGKTLDRIDNTKGYYPENCRWATPAEQQRNTRRNIGIVLKDFAAQKEINYSTIMHRKRVGNQLDAPVREYKKDSGHGTISRYIRQKCRCDVCRKSYSEYQKARRS